VAEQTVEESTVKSREKSDVRYSVCRGALPGPARDRVVVVGVVTVLRDRGVASENDEGDLIGRPREKLLCG
jgi:hypothetical protein